MYRWMHAFAGLIVSHHAVKVNDVTAEQREPVSSRKTSPILVIDQPEGEYTWS